MGEAASSRWERWRDWQMKSCGALPQIARAESEYERQSRSASREESARSSGSRRLGVLTLLMSGSSSSLGVDGPPPLILRASRDQLALHGQPRRCESRTDFFIISRTAGLKLSTPFSSTFLVSSSVSK